MRYLLALFALCSLLVGCSQKSTTDVSVASVNEICPIMGDKVSPKGGTVLWDDKRIGFCCPECIDKWNALSEEENGSKLAASEEHAAEGEHDHHADHVHM